MLPEIHFNRDHGDIDPCPTCQEVINNVFKDDPVLEEEERPMNDDELYYEIDEDSVYDY